MSILGAVFAFIQRNYNKYALLWGSVRRELAMWDALSPLIWQDLQQPWSSTIHSVDASNWGLGHCSAEMAIDEVKHVGRFAEKWRYNNDHHTRAWDSVMSIIEKGDIASYFPIHDHKHVDSHLDASMHAHQADDFDCLINQLDESTQRQHDHASFEPIPFKVVDRPWRVCGRFGFAGVASNPCLCMSTGRASMLSRTS